MLWFWFSLITALAESLKDAAGKQVTHYLNEYVAAWSHRFFALFLLFPALFILGKGSPDATFWYVLIFIAIFDTLTSLFYMRALKVAPLSHTLPILALTPVFMLLTSPIINRETPPLLAILGILLSALGIYIFGLSRDHTGFFAPFRALWQNEGTRLMFFVAATWSISGPLDKVAVLHSNPYFYTAILNTVNMFLLSPFILKRGTWYKIQPTTAAPNPQPQRNWTRNLFLIAPVGILGGLAFLFQMHAVNLTFVPQVIAIKRTSILFGALWGLLFFHEQFEKRKALGTLLLVSGAVTILLA